MKGFFVYFFSILFLSFPCIAEEKQELSHTEESGLDQAQKAKYVFVIGANSGSIEKDQITLKDISFVVYFCNEPFRISGHMSLEKFLAVWEKGTYNFYGNPPHAIVSFYEDGNLKNTVIQMQNPRAEGRSLSFKFRILHGKLPQDLDEVSLFLDGFVQMGEKPNIPVKT